MRTTNKLVSFTLATVLASFGFANSASAKKPVARSLTESAQKSEARESDFVDHADEPRAGLQSNSKEDMDTTARIRRAIVTDRSLSARARNIGIVTDAGVVTLRGDVRSRLEKLAVEKKANHVAGGEAVRSELAVGK